MHGLGDLVESALSAVGLTSDRVEKWLGGPCNCEERKRRLNSLSSWARRVISGKRERALEYLTGILDENRHP